MLKHHIDEILKRNPELAPATEVIEKEILHHDILHVMMEHGALQKLTFIGGTLLRLCYNSSRLSEDLDFNGGHNFDPHSFDGLESEIQDFLHKKYEIPVFVNKPNPERQGNTASWKISIEKEPRRPDLPRQKMHIDVCAIPSFDQAFKVPMNHYGINMPTTAGTLLKVQSMEEVLADKFIALAYRSRRIKPRDLWDIVWLHQQGINIDTDLIDKKLEARCKNRKDFELSLVTQVRTLNLDEQVKSDFNNEMSRFIPLNIQENTLQKAGYWEYLKETVNRLSGKIVPQEESPPSSPFDMSARK